MTSLAFPVWFSTQSQPLPCGLIPLSFTQKYRMFSILNLTHNFGVLLWRLSGEGSACQGRRLTFNQGSEKMPWRKEWQLTPIFLSGKSYGQRSLVGYSPWHHKRVEHDLASQFSSDAQLCPTLRPHESQHARPPCPSPTPGVHSDSRPLTQ